MLLTFEQWIQFYTDLAEQNLTGGAIALKMLEKYSGATVGRSASFVEKATKASGGLFGTFATSLAKTAAHATATISRFGHAPTHGPLIAEFIYELPTDKVDTLNAEEIVRRVVALVYSKERKLNFSGDLYNILFVVCMEQGNGLSLGEIITETNKFTSANDNTESSAVVSVASATTSEEGTGSDPAVNSSEAIATVATSSTAATAEGDNLFSNVSLATTSDDDDSDTESFDNADVADDEEIAASVTNERQNIIASKATPALKALAALNNYAQGKQEYSEIVAGVLNKFSTTELRQEQQRSLETTATGVKAKSAMFSQQTANKEQGTNMHIQPARVLRDVFVKVYQNQGNGSLDINKTLLAVASEIAFHNKLDLKHIKEDAVKFAQVSTAKTISALQATK